MQRSFRVRMALWSALLSGIALAGFAVFAWLVVRDAKLKQLELQVSLYAERETRRLQPVEGWERFEQALASSLLHARDPGQVLLLVEDGSGGVRYRSAHWPAGLDAAQFSWPPAPRAPAEPQPADYQPADSRPNDAMPGPGLPQAPGLSQPPDSGEQPPRNSPPDGGTPAFASPQGGRPEAGDPPPPHEAPRDFRPDGERPYPPPRGARPGGGEHRPPRDFRPDGEMPYPPPSRPQGARPDSGEQGSLEEAPRGFSRYGEALLFALLWPTDARADDGAPTSRITVVPVTVRAGGKNWKLALASSELSRVAVGMSTEMVDSEMEGLRNAFLLALPLALASIALGAWIVSGRALSPVQHLNDSIRNVTARGLDQRIPSGGEDREFAGLIAEFNGMLERLEKSFHQASRFSGDAAHELRTPLTVLQGQIERAMDKAPPGSEVQALLSGILDETGRLSTTLRKLLLLSRADAGRLRLQPVRVDLTAKLAALAEDARMMAPQLKIESTAEPGLLVSADDALLHQLLTNLISNAIKYNVEQGWVRIAALRMQGHVVVTVSNASHGIAPEAREKIFERFYRADASHSRHVEGTGLGLSLAREIARAHGGDLTLSVGRQNDVSLKLVLPGGNAQQ